MRHAGVAEPVPDRGRARHRVVHRPGDPRDGVSEGSNAGRAFKLPAASMGRTLNYEWLYDEGLSLGHRIRSVDEK